MFGLVMSEDRLSLQPRRREIIQVDISIIVLVTDNDLHRQDDGQQHYLMDLMRSPQIFPGIEGASRENP